MYTSCMQHVACLWTFLSFPCQPDATSRQATLLCAMLAGLKNIVVPYLHHMNGQSDLPVTVQPPAFLDLLFLSCLLLYRHQ